MKEYVQSIRFLLLAGACAVGFAAQVSAEVNPKPFVVPELKTWTGSEGAFVPTGRVAYSGRGVKEVAELFAHEYELLTGTKLVVVSGKAKAGDISFALRKNKAEGEEGYTLNIDKSVSALANSLLGLKWASRTLLQMTEHSSAKDFSLPKGSTVDIPEYALRGFSFDVARKYVPMSYLRSLVKIMAYHKMNTLQVHLNDNGFSSFFDNDYMKTQSAFRLESSTFPGLTAKDGSYTKAEFIEFQKMAESYGVTIIPEIDVPAHSLAFTQFKPEIGSKEYGMDHLDLFKPETYEFVDALFKEYLEGDEPVFRGERVHIGTDEYKNATQEVMEKFRYFIDRYIKYVESFGKKAMLWGSLTASPGKTEVKSKDVWMNCWYNGYADPVEMKKLGYTLISIPDGLTYIVPAAGYYYNYLNCQYLYNNWTPAIIGSAKFEENDPSIIGGMFAVWNDHVGNGISVADIHDRVFPALQTMATKCWAGKNTSLPYEEYDRQRMMHSEAPGVNEAGRLPQGGFKADKVEAGCSLPIEKAGYGSTVSFTVDCKDEEKGTELFRSPSAVFYLSDPKEGKLGFSRDGYLNTFNYRLPKQGTVQIAVMCEHTRTTLYIDGKKKEVLEPMPVFVALDQNKFNPFMEGEQTAVPVMYRMDRKMNYQRTLVFPLHKAGNFKSAVSNLEVKASE